MSKKKKDTPAKQEDTAIVPADMESMYAEDAEENLEHVNDAFHRVSIQGSRYKVDERLIGNEGISFVAIVLREVPVNMFYDKRFDPADPTPPDCWSLGGLKPDVSVEHKQSESCLTCVKNRFGTGTDPEGNPGKGKACKNTRRLVLKVPDVDLPVVLSLPPTSTKAFNMHLKMLSNFTSPKTGKAMPLPLAAVLTKFAFDPNVSYPRPIMTMEGLVPPEEYVQIREERKDPVTENALNAYASGAEGEEGAGEDPSDFS